LPNYAFIGKAGSGKTTAADYLVAQYHYRRVSFAAPLKDVAAGIWGTAARTDRNKLQSLGVAVRDIDPDAWVNCALADIDDPVPAGSVHDYDFQPVVIDDCRFPNEYWALKERGFVVVRVQASQNVRVSRLRENGKLQDESQLAHVSETALDERAADYTVYNEDTLGLLYGQLHSIRERELARL
jgi:hypothetical protein